MIERVITMKKVLFTLSIGFLLTSCWSSMSSYDSYGYDDYGNTPYDEYNNSYGYDTYGYNNGRYPSVTVIYNNGYAYNYEASIIEAITNRMVAELALDYARAVRLLELNRRYYYLFHRLPSYSFGYYDYYDRYPRYYGNNGNHYGNYKNKRNGIVMSDKQMKRAAQRYNKAVRSILNNNQYYTFSNRIGDLNHEINIRQNHSRANSSSYRTNNMNSSKVRGNNGSNRGVSESEPVLNRGERNYRTNQDNVNIKENKNIRSNTNVRKSSPNAMDSKSNRENINRNKKDSSLRKNQVIRKNTETYKSEDRRSSNKNQNNIKTSKQAIRKNSSTTRNNNISVQDSTLTRTRSR